MSIFWPFMFIELAISRTTLSALTSESVVLVSILVVWPAASEVVDNVTDVPGFWLAQDL